MATRRDKDSCANATCRQRLARNGKTADPYARNDRDEEAPYRIWNETAKRCIDSYWVEMSRLLRRGEGDTAHIEGGELFCASEGGAGAELERTIMIFRATLIAIVAASLVSVPGQLSAQTMQTKPHVPLEKPIGQAKPEVVPSLFVLNSKGATLKDGKLVLTGISPNAIVFADRPVRAAGHDLTARIVEDWGNGSDNFAKDPPNATVSGFKKDGSAVFDVVVVLKSPKLDGGNLIFDVDVLEGDIAGADGPASVFIDIIGRPLTPMSFAGVARRTAWRGAYYRGAAVAGAAAVGAAAVAYPYYYAPRCGYYPLPPCY